MDSHITMCNTNNIQFNISSNIWTWHQSRHISINCNNSINLHRWNICSWGNSSDNGNRWITRRNNSIHNTITNRKLIELQPTTATIINKNNEEKINALNLKENNIIKIRPGEIVPADCIIIKGISTIDQSIITGESIPVDKTINDEVYAGTINNQGTLIVKVTKDGKENSLQKLIKMIEDINTDDSKIVRQADKWAII